MLHARASTVSRQKRTSVRSAERKVSMLSRSVGAVKTDRPIDLKKIQPDDTQYFFGVCRWVPEDYILTFSS